MSSKGYGRAKRARRGCCTPRSRTHSLPIINIADEVDHQKSNVEELDVQGSSEGETTISNPEVASGGVSLLTEGSLLSKFMKKQGALMYSQNQLSSVMGQLVRAVQWENLVPLAATSINQTPSTSTLPVPSLTASAELSLMYSGSAIPVIPRPITGLTSTTSEVAVGGSTNVQVSTNNLSNCLWPTQYHLLLLRMSLQTQRPINLPNNNIVVH